MVVVWQASSVGACALCTKILYALRMVSPLCSYFFHCLSLDVLLFFSPCSMFVVCGFVCLRWVYMLPISLLLCFLLLSWMCGRIYVLRYVSHIILSLTHTGCGREVVWWVLPLARGRTSCSGQVANVCCLDLIKSPAETSPQDRDGGNQIASRWTGMNTLKQCQGHPNSIRPQNKVYYIVCYTVYSFYSRKSRILYLNTVYIIVYYKVYHKVYREVWSIKSIPQSILYSIL